MSLCNISDICLSHHIQVSSGDAFMKNFALTFTCKNLKLRDGQRSNQIIYYSCADILDSKQICDLHTWMTFGTNEVHLVAFVILIFSDVQGDVAYVTPRWLHHVAHRWLVALLHVCTLGKGFRPKTLVPA